MNNKFNLLVKRLSDKAILPKKGSEKAAGYDLCSIDNYVIPGHGKQLVKTGLVSSIKKRQ